jgi:hypothetical protein
LDLKGGLLRLGASSCDPRDDREALHDENCSLSVELRAATLESL